MARRFCPAAGHSLFTSLIWGWGSSQASSANHGKGQPLPPPPPPSPSPQSFVKHPLGTEKTASSTLGPWGQQSPETQAWAVQTRLHSEDEGPGPCIPQGPKDSHQGSTVTREPRAGSRRKVGSRAQEKDNFYSFKKMYQRVEGRSMLATSPVLSRGLR